MTESLQLGNRVEIFCSYAHEDEELRKEFVSSVALLRQQKVVDVWHDKEILAGGNWVGEIDEHLNTADIVVLLISRHFLNSDFCYAKELTRALEREATKEAVVVPIIVRACDWEDAPFGRLQGIPYGGKPVTSWENREEAWTSVAKSLKLIVREVHSRKLEHLESLTTSEERARGYAQIMAGMPAIPRTKESEEQYLESVRKTEEARRIYAQIMADAPRRKEQDEQLKVLMQSTIFAIDAINQDLGRDKKDFNNMDAYIRG